MNTQPTLLTPVDYYGTEHWAEKQRKKRPSWVKFAAAAATATAAQRDWLRCPLRDFYILLGRKKKEEEKKENSEDAEVAEDG